MSLPTEPIGSIPRTSRLIATMQGYAAGQLGQADLERAGDAAVRETIAALEATGSPVVTDGEQTKPSFATYPVHGSAPGHSGIARTRPPTPRPPSATHTGR